MTNQPIHAESGKPIAGMCGYCGKILNGPNTGEYAAGDNPTPEDITRTTEYKGQAISHSGPCEDCAREKRHWWFGAQQNES